MKSFFLILILIPLITLAQKDSSSGKAITVQANKSIFKDASGKVVTPQDYFSLANSGFYIVSFTNADSDTKIYKIDSTDLLKSIYKKHAPVVLKDLSGNNMKIPTENKITVVNFWSTTCIPCIEEMDSLNLLVHQFPNVKFIAISPDSLFTTTKFLSKKRFDYDIASQCQEIISSFFVTAYPTHLVYDKNGVLQNIIIGNAPNLRELIEGLKKK
jgi:thiol-disulfide isomerase/thioredoxin